MSNIERRFESKINSTNRSDARDQAGSTTDPHKKDDMLKEKLKKLLLDAAGKYRKMKENPSEGFKDGDFVEIEIPAGDNLRVDENKYRDCLGYIPLQINKHMSQVAISENRWKGQEKFGEKLEEITAILLLKILGDDFVILRTSKHDDYHYKKEYVSDHGESGHWECEGLADLILCNVRNGDICIIDVVCPDWAPDNEKENKRIEDRLKAKFLKIFQINKSGGALLEYGLTIDTITKIEGGKHVAGKALRPGRPDKKLPVFLFTYSKNATDELRESVSSSLEETSEAEYEAFKVLALQMQDQIASFGKHSDCVRHFSGNSFKRINEIANIDNLTPDDKKRIQRRAKR